MEKNYEFPIYKINLVSAHHISLQLTVVCGVNTVQSEQDVRLTVDCQYSTYFFLFAGTVCL